MFDIDRRRMNDEIDARVGQRIGNLRRAAGMTRQELAKCIGVTSQQLQAYEAGAQRVPASHLWVIAAAQDAPVHYYFEDDS